MIGAHSVVGKDLVGAAERFLNSSEEWIQNRGLAATTIAFVGTTKAGKTTLLRLLVHDEKIAQQLISGIDVGTEKVTWIGPEAPSMPDLATELVIPCEREFLEEITGARYSLIDVPGEDDDSGLRQAAAAKALDWARIKVLVLSPREIRDGSYTNYLGHCKGATVLPVINRVDPSGLSRELREEVEGSVRRAIGNGTVLPVMVVADFEHRAYGGSRIQWEETTRAALLGMLEQALQQADPEKELAAKLTAFQSEVRQFLDSHLCHASRAFEDLRAAEKDLPATLVRAFFEPEDGFKLGFRRKLRGRYLALTPQWAFPWRPFLGLANLIEGAIDRAALAMMGSLPASIQVLFAAGRNKAADLRFDQKLQDSCTRRMEAVAAGELRPLVRCLQAALERDLRRGQTTTTPRKDRIEISVEGTAGAVAQLKQAVDEKVIDSAPGTAGLHALIGTTLFAGFFAWPIFALYGSYISAWGTFDLVAYPSQVWNALVLSFLLSVLPMCAWMIASNAVLFRKEAVDRCFTELRQAATNKESELRDCLQISFDQPEVAALLSLRRFVDGGTVPSAPSLPPFAPETEKRTGRGSNGDAPDDENTKVAANGAPPVKAQATKTEAQ